MGFWDFIKDTKKGLNEEKNRTEKELTETEQLAENAISHMLSPDYKLAVYDEYSINSFQTGKRILHNQSCMNLFKKAAKQYVTIWKPIVGKFYTDSWLYRDIEDAVMNLGRSAIDRLDYVKLLNDNVSGKFDGIDSIFSDPIVFANTEKNYEQERLLSRKIKRLNIIVNKPIKYGDTGNSKDEINFGNEFNAFVGKLREQKMDEITIFKLVSRMGELKEQYESVIKHPDRSLLERLEAQVLLELCEQLKKQTEKRGERQGKAIMKGKTLPDSTEKEDTLILSCAKIIDELFGY